MSDAPKHTAIVNVMSIKGGAGKSVVALALGIMLAKTRTDLARVIYLDTDFSGTCTRDGIGEHEFGARPVRGRPDYQYLEELFRHISTPLNHPEAFFDQFPFTEDRLWLAFSASDHRAAEELSKFLDNERYTDFMLHRLLDLCGHALAGVRGDAVVIVDNGPGIYGLGLGLLAPDKTEHLQHFVCDRNLASLGERVSVGHLFVATPDRQDKSGILNLLMEHIRRRKDKGIVSPLPYFVIMNASRGSMTGEQLEKEKLDLEESFREIKEFGSRYEIVSDLEWLRLFVDKARGGVPLWQQDVWEKRKLEVQGRLQRVAETLCRPPGQP